MMRSLFIALLLTTLTACAAPQCQPGTFRDGGIGGTGGCVAQPVVN